jgi:hypothetical protein
MMTKTFQVKIQHEVFGTLLSETFVNAIQFKLFLKMIQGSIELKKDLTFFNGEDFFIHIPYKNLNESIITTFHETYTLAEHMINKSKIEAVHTK